MTDPREKRESDRRLESIRWEFFLVIEIFLILLVLWLVSKVFA